MQFLRHIFIFSLIFISLSSCKQEEQGLDLVISNAVIHTVSGSEASFDAIGVKNGKITILDNSENLTKQIEQSKNHIDAGGNFLMPGFIEGHGHYSGLGKSIQNLNFLRDTSWQQVTARVKEKIDKSENGEWIYGRGWHQEKWNLLPDQALGKYPIHTGISQFSEENPVVLIHASGHSLFANEKAMKIAGISKETPDPDGGLILRDENKEAIGVFEERAMKPILSAYQEYLDKRPIEEKKKVWKEAIKLAEDDCLKKGITSFQDAGSKFFELEWYKEMAENGELDIRLWVMARHSAEELKNVISNYRFLNAGNGFYTCRALKSELDGALGAHGAWLLDEYEDKPGFHGQNTTPVSEVEAIAEMAYNNNMQLCVHAIGDKANRKTLDIFEKYKLMDTTQDLRWRVEHAQHLSVDDIPRFKEIGAIASMQGVHCTSDAPFVETRLGEERAKEGAYAWRALLDAGAVVVNGTDAPVEDVDPIASIYASVTRKRENPSMEFFPDQRMTRKEAIYSYTMAAAFAGFEENYKGSIEIGKYADFVILDTNLLTCEDDEIEKSEVLYTIVNGVVKYNMN